MSGMLRGELVQRLVEGIGWKPTSMERGNHLRRSVVAWWVGIPAFIIVAVIVLYFVMVTAVSEPPEAGLPNAISLFEPGSNDERNFLWLASQNPDHLFLGAHGFPAKDGHILALDERDVNKVLRTPDDFASWMNAIPDPNVRDLPVFLVICNSDRPYMSFARGLSERVGNVIIGSPEYMVFSGVSGLQTMKYSALAIPSVVFDSDRLILTAHQGGQLVDTYTRDYAVWSFLQGIAKLPQKAGLAIADALHIGR